MYKKLKVNNKEEALDLVKRFCRCVKLSFVGVSWIENGEEQKLTWEDIPNF